MSLKLNMVQRTSLMPFQFKTRPSMSRKVEYIGNKVYMQRQNIERNIIKYKVYSTAHRSMKAKNFFQSLNAIIGKKLLNTNTPSI